MSSASEDKQQPIDGSQLCLSCGLCCQGLLHDWAKLRNGEVEAAERLGLSTEVRQEDAMFSLPCPCHLDNRCTIYQERLSPCREYRCKLLRGYVSGQVTWQEGIRRVEQAKQLVAAIRGRLEAPASGASIWQQLRAADAGRIARDAEAQMEIASLLTHCQRHFWNRAKPERTFAP